jgi:hypothetical protein
VREGGEAEELAAFRVEEALFDFGDSWVDEQPAIFLKSVGVHAFDEASSWLKVFVEAADDANGFLVAFIPLLTTALVARSCRRERLL